MARRNRGSQLKREREQKKRERQRKKADKAALKRERRFGDGESTVGEEGPPDPNIEIADIGVNVVPEPEDPEPPADD
jgi:hypothetical protein